MRKWCLIYCKSVPMPILFGYFEEEGDYPVEMPPELSDGRVGVAFNVKCVAAKLPFPLYGSAESNGESFLVPLYDYHDFLLFEQEYGVRPLHKR